MDLQFSKRLRDIRKAKSFSTAGLASALSVDTTVIRSWENGTNLPDIEQLLELSTLLGVSVDFLLKGKREKQQKVLIGAQNSTFAYGRITKNGIVDELNQDYLPNGWKVIQTQLFVNAEGEDNIFVVIEK